MIRRTSAIYVRPLAGLPYLVALKENGVEARAEAALNRGVVR